MSAPATQRGVVRSYQRIFRPDRRLYQVEGHRIPIPGGVPLAWMGYATAALVAVLVLPGRSIAVSLLVAATAGTFAAGVGGGRAALSAALIAFLAVQVVGMVLGVLDWPLRLLVVPGLIATLGTHATPDGRSAHRYALSWLALQVRPVRRFLGRELPVDESRHLLLRVGVGADHRAPRLQRGQVTGPATATPAAPVVLREGRWPWSRGRAVIRPTTPGDLENPEQLLSGPLALQVGERLEVRS